MNDREILEQLLKPFWTGKTVHQESLFFVKKADNRPESRLLFIPEAVLAVQSADLTISYIEGRDYVVDTKKKTITLPPTSKIPYKTTQELYLPKSSAGCPAGIR